MKSIAVVGGGPTGAMAAECLARGAAARTEWGFKCAHREFTRHEGACYSGRWEAAAFFYCGSLAGDVTTSRSVQFGAGSRTFHEIVEKVVQGTQS